MQTSRCLFTDVELQLRILLEISDIFLFVCFSYFQVLLYSQQLFSHLHEKSLFTVKVWEKQRMRVI